MADDQVKMSAEQERWAEAERQQEIINWAAWKVSSFNHPGAKVRNRMSWTRLVIINVLLTVVFVAEAVWITANGGSIFAYIIVFITVLTVVNLIRHRNHGGRIRFTSWLTRS